jgi:hypothetical protein
MKHIMMFETYLDTKGNKTEFEGGEKVKVFNYVDKRDVKPGDTRIGIVKRVENDKVLVQFENEKGMKSSATYDLDHFVKQGDMFVEK